VLDAANMRRVICNWQYGDISEVIDLPSCVKYAHGNLISYGDDDEAVFLTHQAAHIKAVHAHFAKRLDMQLKV
jgi:hypothetical protein